MWWSSPWDLPWEKKKKAGAAPEGATPAVTNIKKPAGPWRPAAFAAAVAVAGLQPVLAVRTRERATMEASWPEKVKALSRRDDRDLTVRADRQQMCAVTGHDVLRPSGDCRSDYVVIVHIVGNDTRDFARRHDYRRITICRHHLLDRCGSIGNPFPKSR
jgi:hypothetical protein